ncbi:MAG: 30S ribosomal protein S1 [Anaerotruncus sp.]|jgi:small subunit ribosomal protein S1|nr:30S ribosomal protein S1 [Anaerotruncus sp.]
MRIYQPEGLLLDTAANRLAFQSAATLEEACASGQILESRAIVCDSEHNLIVDMGAWRGIIPREEGALGIAEGTTRDIAIISRVNKPVCYRITGFTREGGVLIPQLSRRAVQQECMQQYICKLTPGDVIPARATHLESFGCFVDIGCGIPSLIPIDAISVSRISHPRDRFRNGQLLYAVVRALEPDGRVSLSHKELLGSWEENAAQFGAGETVAGIVRSVEEYGVFIELTPNLAGLAEPHEGIAVGQHASVYIKSLLPEKMKVKLIIVDAFDANYRTPPAHYFITEGHIDHWRYSPIGADRLIETTFC